MAETTKKAAAPKKPRATKKEAEAVPEMVPTVRGSYLYGLGRRKTSIARVRVIKTGTGKVTINGKPMAEYFTTYAQRTMVEAPLKITGNETAVDIEAMAQGGGLNGQAEAVRLGTSRALLELNPTYRKTLKKLGFLTRDPRAKERKKFGLKRARRAPQWSKR
jgi:small subunit ribosomal protein S9